MPNYEAPVIKIIIIGSSGSGKTSLVNRFVDNIFAKSFATTLGLDHRSKELLVDGNRYVLQLWDTPGQERFRSITRSCYKQAQGIIVVSDQTNSNAVEELENWIEIVKEESSKSAVFRVTATKIDLKRVVEKEKIQKVLDRTQIKLTETSSKNNINVQELFIQLVQDIVKNQQQTVSDLIYESSPLKKKHRFWCC